MSEIAVSGWAPNCLASIQPSPNLSMLERMGMYSWDIEGFGSVQQSARTPRLTIRCEYPGGCMEPTCVSFRLSPSYGICTGREAHDWFLRMMHEHDEFEVETDEPGEWPVPFCSETISRVMVE